MKWMPILFLLILATALSLRLPHLADRPMHHDESNQAYRFGQLLETGTYEYDSDDHHGPALYYFTLPVAWLTGAKTFAETSETTYRILSVLFGLLLIVCTPLLRNGIGCIAVLVAAYFTAISPAMAYYSRFYIQEILLTFFSLLTIAAGWQAWRSGSSGWSIITGIFAGLMFATKETAVISFAAMLGALLSCGLVGRKEYIPLKNLALATLSASAVAALFFSSFFANPEGVLDSILAFKIYFAHSLGVGTDHIHPWNFYLKMLTFYRLKNGPIWSEGLIFGTGILGIVSILRNKTPSHCDPGLARFLMFYTLLLTFAYTVIPYKTPWCILTFLHGWILLGAIGVASVFEAAEQGRMPRLQSAIIIAIVLTLGYETYRLAERTVFRYAADYRNPYVYAHTSPDFTKLVRRINDLARVSPKGKSLYIQVVTKPKQTWPLPFYLREFPNTGYWKNADDAPSNPKPDIIISAPGLNIDPGQYLSEFYGLRPGIPLSIHIDADLWNAFIKSRQ